MESLLSGTVDKDQYVYWQVPANFSTGVTLKLDITTGSATVYASLSTRLPSASDYDFVAIGTTYNLGQIYISPEELLKANSSSSFILSDMVALNKADATVYTSVQGMSDTSAFTLHYEPENTVVPVNFNANVSGK